MADLDDDFEPIQIEPGAAPEPERITIFRIGEEAFTAPKEVPMAIALSAIRLARRTGWIEAVWFMVEQSIGEEAINRLMTSKADPEQISGVLGKLRELYMGQTEAIAGKLR